MLRKKMELQSINREGKAMKPTMDSSEWGGEIYGILDKEGNFWSPLTFESVKQVLDFLDKRLGYGAVRRHKLTIVPVHTEMTATIDPSSFLPKPSTYLSDKERRPSVYAAAKKAFDETPEDIKGDLESALEWAKEKLKRKERGEYSFSLLYEDGFKCCFSQPRWPSDHCSAAMPEAAEAIVMAVCEYLNGV